MSEETVVPLRPRRRLGLQQWPITIVLLGVALSMAVIAVASFRRGCVVLAATILLAAFLRMLLSNRDAGWLAVRSKGVDVGVLLVMGLGLAILSFWVPAPN